MSESWINTRGKKFVGQTAAVPAPDEKAAGVVDYKDLKDLTILVTQSSIDPSEALNDDKQVVTITAAASLDGINAYGNWAYDFTFSVDASGIPVEFDNLMAVSGGFSVDVIFPAGVTEGQVGKIKVLSDDHKAALSITVTA